MAEKAAKKASNPKKADAKADTEGHLGNRTKAGGNRSKGGIRQKAAPAAADTEGHIATRMK